MLPSNTVCWRAADAEQTASNRLARGRYGRGAEGKIPLSVCSRRFTNGRSIEDKTEAVNAYLRELESHPARVRSLAGWAWIDDSIRCLPAHLAAASQ